MQTVTLPASRLGITFSLDARRLIGEDPHRWEGILRLAALGLRAFADAQRAPAAAWFTALPWTDRKNQQTSLLTLSLCTDAAASRETLHSLWAPIVRANRGWSMDGVHERPDAAQPIAYGAPDAGVSRVWVQEPGGPTRYAWRAFGPATEALVLGADAASDTPEGLGDVLALAASTAQTDARERLKLAFAYSVARAIVQADGVLDQREEAFLGERFGPEQLAAHGFADVDALQALATEAEAALPGLLGHHEKLALLSTFFATCWADGSVDVRELRTLKEASHALGLEPAEVASYLLRVH